MEIVLMIPRRGFIKTVALSTGAMAASSYNLAGTSDRMPNGILDTNVSLSRWPFRRLPLDETKKLVGKLKQAGVTEAWAGSYDGLLHKNLGAVNDRLAAECEGAGNQMLRPFGTVNPKVPDWREDLRRCHEHHRMRGIRLFPNYHGFKLDDPDFGKLLAAAESRSLVVQLALSMEDERVQHSLVRVPNVNAEPLPELLSKFPKLKVVLLNWFRSVKSEVLPKLVETKQVWFDIAMVEGVGGINNLLQNVSAEQIVFGSHAPFFYFESSLLKLRESLLSSHQLQLIEHASAKRCFRSDRMTG